MTTPSSRATTNGSMSPGTPIPECPANQPSSRWSTTNVAPAAPRMRNGAISERNTNATMSTTSARVAASTNGIRDVM